MENEKRRAQRQAIIAALECAWDRYPYLRFGQLVSNVYTVQRNVKPGANMFYIQDSEMLDAFWNYFVGTDTEPDEPEE